MFSSSLSGQKAVVQLATQTLGWGVAHVIRHHENVTSGLLWVQSEGLLKQYLLLLLFSYTDPHKFQLRALLMSHSKTTLLCDVTTVS